MKEKIEEKDMDTKNVVSVKVEKEERFYPKQFGEPVTKIINRTKYLKRCWLCGEFFESNIISAKFCRNRCGVAYNRLRKSGSNCFIDLKPLMKWNKTEEEQKNRGYL